MTSVSIVINTCNRAVSLSRTLEALTWLDHDDFEVVVVDGPSTDGTPEVLEAWSDRIKIGRCEHLNLAESRNIGIALAAGELVAFIDDDAYPDPSWLRPLIDGYNHSEVAGVGGPVYDHTGVGLQTRYNLCTRLSDARASHDVLNPSDYLSTPNSDLILYLIGTNSTYRRERLVEIGGFDEEFEYYLDDTEVCTRLADRGYSVRVVDDGFVYHKFLESHIRTPRRHFRYRYPIIKNKLYFALRFGLVTHSFDEVCDYIMGFIADQHRDFESALAMGWLTEDDYAQFKADVPAAFDAALARWASGDVRIRDRAWFAEHQQPYKRFATRRRPEDKLNVCFLTLEYPPKPLQGIGRVIYNLASGMAAIGHVVHVLTPGEEQDTVDLEDGVWVHRIVPKEHPLPETLHVPPSVWYYAASLRDEVRRIHAHRPVDIVQCPNWGSQGIAVMLDGSFTTVLGMYTPLRTITGMDHRLAPGSESDAHVAEMITLEEFCYRNAGAYLACGESIVEEVESQYAVDIPRDRLGFVPHGLSDGALTVDDNPDPQGVNVLFVGRLEPRKGIDVFLACIPDLVHRFPDVVFTIVGDDTIPSGTGATYRSAFERSRAGSELRDRVRFLGPVDDDELWRQYARCDVFVAPSRYESFGLILVEAMTLAKPVIGCAVGGMPEIVEHDGNGFLVSPGSSAELGDAIAKLVSSAELRHRMGARSRELYEERYSVSRMVEGVNRFYDRIAGRTTALAQHRFRRNRRRAPSPSRYRSRRQCRRPKRCLHRRRARGRHGSASLTSQRCSVALHVARCFTLATRR